MSLGRHTTEFDRIYEEYSDAIFRHLYFRLQDRDRALDLTQEVFTRLWQYLSGGKKVDYPKAFLYRSASNAFINEIRGGKRTVSLNSLADAGFDVRQDKYDLEEIAAQKEIVEKLRHLDPVDREVIVMRYIDGLRVKDIAQLLGKGENNISVQIKRALEKAKKIYEKPA